MALKNKTQYAILGVLTLRSGSGYDIKKFCDKTISHFWNENFGHIYPVLNQLLKAGLIELEKPEMEARRKVYRITEKGRMEFHKWLMEPVEYQPARSELLLKLSFGNQMTRDKAIEMLEELKKRYISKLQEYRNLETPYVNNPKALTNPVYPYLLASLRYGIMAAETTINWCDETIKNINNHHVEV